MRLSKKRRKLLLKVIYFLSAGIVAWSIYFFLTFKGLYITSAVVQNPLYEERIQNDIKEEFADKVWYFFPSQHIVFLPISRIEKDLYLKYPEIKTIDIKRKGFQTIEVTITLRIPLFRLEDGLAMDEDGVVYKEPNDISALPLFTFVSDFPTEDDVHALKQLAEKIAIRLAPINTIKIDGNKDVQYLFSDDAHYVIAPLSGDPSVIWSTLVSALDTEPLATLLQTKKNELEYIDLRFGNKVFYKFSKGNSISTSTPSVSH